MITTLKGQIVINCDGAAGTYTGPVTNCSAYDPDNDRVYGVVSGCVTFMENIANDPDGKQIITIQYDCITITSAMFNGAGSGTSIGLFEDAIVTGSIAVHISKEGNRVLATFTGNIDTSHVTTPCSQLDSVLTEISAIESKVNEFQNAIPSLPVPPVSEAVDKLRNAKQVLVNGISSFKSKYGLPPGNLESELYVDIAGISEKARLLAADVQDIQSKIDGIKNANPGWEMDSDFKAQLDEISSKIPPDIAKKAQLMASLTTG